MCSTTIPYGLGYIITRKRWDKMKAKPLKEMYKKKGDWWYEKVWSSKKTIMWDILPSKACEVLDDVQNVVRNLLKKIEKAKELTHDESKKVAYEHCIYEIKKLLVVDVKE